MSTPKPEEKSKSQIKREHLLLQKLSKQLVELPDKILQQLSLSDSLMDAIRHTKTLSHGALKRELRYIAGIIDPAESEVIQKNIAAAMQPHHTQTKTFHQAEQWRDQLIAGDESLINDLLVQFPDIDRQQLRQLVRNANKERAQNKPPKSSRLLFKLLHQLLIGKGG